MSKRDIGIDIVKTIAIFSVVGVHFFLNTRFYRVDLNNKKCIFIDDVYATGGTYKACKKLVEQNQGIMENAYVISK